MRGLAFTRVVLLAVFALTVGGCAQVKIRKVPTPTQYQTWTDKEQRKADAMQGFRYYLPRPWVSVFESFPIASDVYIADGVVSADGKYVFIDQIRSESPLGRFFVNPEETELGRGAMIPAGTVALRQTRREIGRDAGAESDEGALDGDTLTKAKAALEDIENAKVAALASSADAALSADAADQAAEEAKEPGTDGGAAADGQGGAPGTGTNRVIVTNNNGAFAYQPLRGSFDIVYLPDMDEQYVVSSRAGLGNAQIAMNLGQGWSLQGFNSVTDNSRINELMFDLIETATKAAGAVVTSGGSTLAELVSKGSDALVQPQGGEGTLEQLDQAVPGTRVSLLISVNYYAAKGLYPVIKPRELSGLPADGVLLDLMAGAGSDGSVVAKALMGMDNAQVKGAIRAFEQTQGRFSIPVYPYQYISFNTFRVARIELLQAATLPSEAVLDPSGTSGDPGDAETKAFTDLLLKLIAKNAGIEVSDRTTPNTDALTELSADENKLLQEQTGDVKRAVEAEWANEDDLRQFTLAGIQWEVVNEEGNLKAVLTVQPNPQDQAIRTRLATIAEPVVREHTAKAPLRDSRKVAEGGVSVARPVPAESGEGEFPADEEGGLVFTMDEQFARVIQDDIPLIIQGFNAAYEDLDETERGQASLVGLRLTRGFLLKSDSEREPERWYILIAPTWSLTEEMDWLGLPMHASETLHRLLREHLQENVRLAHYRTDEFMDLYPNDVTERHDEIPTRTESE